jgi:hypothetical protein
VPIVLDQHQNYHQNPFKILTEEEAVVFGAPRLRTANVLSSVVVVLINGQLYLKMRFQELRGKRVREICTVSLGTIVRIQRGLRYHAREANSVDKVVPVLHDVHLELFVLY